MDEYVYDTKILFFISYLEDVHLHWMDCESKNIIVELPRICVCKGGWISNQLKRKSFHFVLHKNKRGRL